MRKILNKIIGSSGYEIQKIGRTTFLLRKLLKTKSELSFIQVGANDGVNFDNMYPFFISHKCKGLVIEPIPLFFERLCLNYKGYPQIIPLNVAIHKDALNCSIYSVQLNQLQQYPISASGIASFNREHLKKHGIDESAIAETIVPCRSLMSLIDEYKMTDLDFLQIDTEGFDDEIIKMIDFSLVRPKIIKFETAHLGISQKKEVFDLLKHEGYSIINEPRDAIAHLKF